MKINLLLLLLLFNVSKSVELFDFIKSR